MSEALELLDYRRRVSEIYRTVRLSPPGADTWHEWRKSRGQLFATHPQTPLENPTTFESLDYFDFDPTWRTEGRLSTDAEKETTISHSGAGATSFFRIGRIEFELGEMALDLDVLWLNAYGGGIFIPFRDGTNGTTTYGGGRYLIDTVKGADLGSTGDRLILDFNYAYHPSCVHSPQWSCPLSPPDNTLDLDVTAGERMPGVSEGHETR